MLGQLNCTKSMISSLGNGSSRPQMRHSNKAMPVQVYDALTE